MSGLLRSALHHVGCQKSMLFLDLEQSGHGMHNLWRFHCGVEHPFATFDVHQGCDLGFDPQPTGSERLPSRPVARL